MFALLSLLVTLLNLCTGISIGIETGIDHIDIDYWQYFPTASLTSQLYSHCRQNFSYMTGKVHQFSFSQLYGQSVGRMRPGLTTMNLPTKSELSTATLYKDI